MTDLILKGVAFKTTFDKSSVGEFLFERANEHEDKICQIDAELDISETYKSVKNRSVRVAIQLQKRGVTSKDVICTCAYNTIDNTIPIIATLFLGAKTANLDPTLSVRNTKHLLQLISPKIIFVEEDSLHLIETSLNEAKLDSKIIVFGKSEKYETFSDLVQPLPNENDFRPPKVDIYDIAVMFFSSGTTGLPKAICHSHYSFLQMTEISYHCGYPTNRILHFTSMYWISGLSLLTRIFMDGSTRVFGRNAEGKLMLQMIEKYKLQSLFMAPIYTYELTAVANPERYDVFSFKFLLTGGTPISDKQYKKLCHLFPKAKVLFGYGMSEIGLLTMFNPQLHQDFLTTKIGSCGQVAPQTLIKVVNPNTEEILGPNQKGEIRAKSPGLMKGYFNSDSSSCLDKNGFLKTGDVGYYDDDGCFYIVERIKEMFKYKSWHIVPSSIERVLLEHPAVKETVVFGIPRGEDGEIPAACVVLEQEENVDKEEIEKFVAERVSDREKLRGGVILVQNLPKTPTGKLLRNEVRNNVIKSM